MGSSQNLSEKKHTILNRLRSAEGHLHGVILMCEADDSCEEVLQQLNAVEAALCAVGRLLWDGEFQRCAEIILRSPDANIRVAEIKRLTALCRVSKHLLAVADVNGSDSNDQTIQDCSAHMALHIRSE